MKVRDEFARTAMQVILDKHFGLSKQDLMRGGGGLSPAELKRTAELAYEIADAMMEQSGEVLDGPAQSDQPAPATALQWCCWVKGTPTTGGLYALDKGNDKPRTWGERIEVSRLGEYGLPNAKWVKAHLLLPEPPFVHEEE